MSRIGVFFAEGYEEIEALTVVDLLRRADIQVDMVSITEERTVKGSHGIAVGMDQVLSKTDFGALDGIVLPGGMPGTRNLEHCDDLMKQVDAFVKDGKLVCAICAAPSILGHRGHLQGRKDGNIITARGMGCAIAFGLAIIEKLQGRQAADEMAQKVVYQQ